TPYRPEGWTVRQVIHHLADSHMNAFIRFKLALTESNPTITPFDESLWADLPDGKKSPIDSSLKIIEGLHFRWTALLNSLSEDQFQRTYFHPDHGKKWTLENVLALYSWHSSHHLAHITSLKDRMNWN
ncbi:MAG: YfiT family bacillithiol transferase, partial [Daejeonella sp.]